MDTEAPTPERLKSYRFERGGWTVAAAAELCGVTVATWHGWTLRDGWFYSPENVGFSTGETRALPLLHALIAELKRTAVKPAARPRPRLARIA